MKLLEFNSVFGWLALISTGIILIQLVLSIFFGSFDIDFDADGDTDFDLGTIASPKGVIQFIAGGSWYLLLKTPHNVWDYFIAIGIGLIVALSMALLCYGIYKIGTDNKVNETGELLVGRSAEIYIPLENNTYEVSIVINGAKSNLTVKSADPEKKFKTGEIVNIYEIKI